MRTAKQALGDLKYDLWLLSPYEDWPGVHENCRAIGRQIRALRESERQLREIDKGLRLESKQAA